MEKRKSYMEDSGLREMAVFFFFPHFPSKDDSSKMIERDDQTPWDHFLKVVKIRHLYKGIIT